MLQMPFGKGRDALEVEVILFIFVLKGVLIGDMYEGE